MTFEISDMHEHHVDGVANIELRTNATPWSASTFLAEINSPTHMLLVALQSDKVIGFSGGQLVGDELHIHSLAVHEEHRRQGAGKALIVDLLRKATERDATKATLEVRVGNDAARKLYDSLGFTESGIRPKYYRDNGEDAVIMWLNEMVSS